ncbi:MAG: hypothetical protein O2944_01785 [Proteobacteria bacterium]|nr:hypothetical protein [Pseudomonadota bacterium]
MKFTKMISRGTVSIIMIAALPGCDHIRSMYSVDPVVTDTNSQDNPRDTQPINLDTYIFPEQRTVGVALTNGKLTPVLLNAGTTVPTAYKTSLNDTQSRNRLIDAIIARSNEICKTHKAHILANSALLNFASSVISTILSGASAAVGGEAAKTALSTASASVNATGASIKAEFYQNLLSAAIVREIEKKREAELAKIKQRRGETNVAYSIDEAIRDVAIYHEKCSFFVGVTSLANDKEDQMSFEDINARISTLRIDNVQLRTTLGSLASGAVGKADIESQIKLNDASIIRLKVLSQMAKGTGDGSSNPAAQTSGVAAGSGATPPPAAVTPAPVTAVPVAPAAPSAAPASAKPADTGG